MRNIQRLLAAFLAALLLGTSAFAQVSNVRREHVVEFIRGTGVVTDGVTDASAVNGPWTFVAPVGVSTLYATGCSGGAGGGGGGGINGVTAGMGGGGGGSSGVCIAHFPLQVVPGASLTVTVNSGGGGGAVGAAGATGSTGTSGGAVTVSGLLVQPGLSTSTTLTLLGGLGGVGGGYSASAIGAGGNGGANPINGANGGAGGATTAQAGSQGGTIIQTGYLTPIAPTAMGASGGGASLTTPWNAAGGNGALLNSAGISPFPGLVNVTGGTGITDTAFTNNSYGGGGAGASSPLGQGGAGGNGQVAGSAATGYGAGGGGGGGNKAGAAGTNGYLRFTYTQ